MCEQLVQSGQLLALYSHKFNDPPVTTTARSQATDLTYEIAWQEYLKRNENFKITRRAVAQTLHPSIRLFITSPTHLDPNSSSPGYGPSDIPLAHYLKVK